MGVQKIDKIRNTEIKNRIEIIPLIQNNQEKKLRWFGQMNQMDRNIQIRRLWDARTEEKHRNSRPRKTWNEDWKERRIN